MFYINNSQKAEDVYKTEGARKNPTGLIRDMMKKEIATESEVKRVNTAWRIDFSVNTHSGDFRLLRLEKNGKSVLEIIKNSNRTVSVTFGTENDTKFCTRLSARIKNGQNKVSVVSLGYKYQLIVNGYLKDEDWPITPADINGTVCTVNSANAVLSDTDIPDMPAYKAGTVTTIDKMICDGMDCYFGDCMPMEHNGVFHLFYLYDRRRHASKSGFGGHQWAHISSTDLINWTRHEMAVTIESNKEAAFRTGSVVFHNNKFYAYYVTVQSDRSLSPITYSTSTDGRHFEKSGKSFFLDDRYDNIGVRDPKVFFDDDGNPHMLLSTKLKTPEGLKGCMLHLRSSDMENWVADEKPFLLLDIPEFPECPDYFRWNGYYYFTYCVNSVSHYMFSDKPFEGFVYRENQLVGGNGFVVPQSATFGGRRIAVAFSWIPFFGYAGEPVFLEMKQNPDGTLSFEIPIEFR